MLVTPAIFTSQINYIESQIKINYAGKNIVGIKIIEEGMLDSKQF